MSILAACGGGEPAEEPADAGPAQAASEAVSPSFDCGQAEGAVEELICTTPELATLDLRLDSIWREIETRFVEQDWPESEEATVRAEQRGWIGGRNECWQASDPTACTRDLYRQRVATLQAQWGLVEGGEPSFWSCEGNPSNEFVLTFFQTDPPSVRVERGDRQEVMIQTRTASGARYLGTFGKEVWVKGDEGTFVWPQEDTLRCEPASGG